MRQKIVEKLMHVLFFIAACASVLAVVLICLFLFRNGIPAIGEIGITKFLLGQKWKPSNNLYGILPFILGSIYVTAGSSVVGVPTALLLAVFLAFYCPKKLYPIFKTTVNLMAGVPSVVYGFFGLVVIVPLMNELTGHDGSTMLTASILLGIMILPTVTGVAESALRSVPTMRVRWRSGRHMNGVYFSPCSRRQNPESWQESCLVSVGRSERRWQSSW